MDIHTLLEITYSKCHPLCHVVLRRQQMLLRVSDVVIHFWKWFFHDFRSICLGTSFRFRKNKIGEQLFQMRRVISNATAKETPPNKYSLFQENRENNKNNISKEMCVSGQQNNNKTKNVVGCQLKVVGVAPTNIGTRSQQQIKPKKIKHRQWKTSKPIAGVGADFLSGKWLIKMSFNFRLKTLLVT